MKSKLSKQEQIASGKPLSTLISLSIPASISMLVQSFYSIVDSIFVANIDQTALTGMYIVFPISMIISAVSVGLGTGVNSCMSRFLGSKKVNDAKRIIFSGFSIGTVCWILFIIVGLFFSTLFVSIFTTDASVISYGSQYMLVVSAGCVGAIFNQVAFSVLQGTGQMVVPMICQIIGAVLNTILDPLLIYGLLFFPQMGIVGAALATVIAQVFSAIVSMWYVFSSKNKVVKIRISELFQFSPKWQHYKNTLGVAIPAIANQALSSVMTTFLNLILGKFGNSAIAIYGIYYRVYGFCYMPVFGVVRAGSGLLGYSYGAKNYSRFKSIVNSGMIICGIIGFIATLIFMIFPDLIISWFAPTEEVATYGPICFRIVSLSFSIAGVSIFLSSCFAPVWKSYLTLISSILRQFVIILPLCWLFGEIGGMNLLWAAFPVSDAINLIFVIILYFWFLKQWRGQLKNGEAS